MANDKLALESTENGMRESGMWLQLGHRTKGNSTQKMMHSTRTEYFILSGLVAGW